MKRKAFWLHFNKPASLKAGDARWSIHYEGKCIIVRHFILKAQVMPRYRKTQPICVLAGKGFVKVVDGVAIITE